MKLSKLIQKKMKANCLSYRQLASLSGRDVAYVYRLTNDQQHNPCDECIKDILGALDVYNYKVERNIEIVFTQKGEKDE